MDPVKRRLVYVADESETLLNELSGTPPTRPSRMTRLLVPLSPPSSSQRSSGALSPPPRPVATSEATPVVQVDRELLVSYNGFLLVDGSGHFAMPHNAAEAALLRDALKTCRAYLKQFLADQRESSASTESLSSRASSSTYKESEEDTSEMNDSSDDSFASPRHRRAKAPAARLPTGSAPRPSKMTVVELKELLRERGVPAVGNKANLVLRAKSMLAREKQVEKQQAVSPCDGVDEASAASPPPSPSPSTASAHTVRHSAGSASSHLLSPASSLLASPTSRASTESRGLWGALITVSSRLFCGNVRRSLGYPGSSGAPLDDDAPPMKRRRSA